MGSGGGSFPGSEDGTSLLPAECMVAGVRQEEKEREPCAGTHADRHIHTFFFCIITYLLITYLVCLLLSTIGWHFLSLTNI